MRWSSTVVDEAIYQLDESSLEMTCVQLWWLSYYGDYQFKIYLELSRVVSSDAILLFRYQKPVIFHQKPVI